MATVNLPNQNLSLQTLDSGQIGYVPNDSTGGILARQGSTLYDINLQNLGALYAKQNNIAFNGGSQAVDLGKQYLQSIGIDPSTIGNYSGSIPDAVSGAGVAGMTRQTVGLDPTLLKTLFTPQQVQSGEVFTQGTSPTNPNAPTVTSSLTGNVDLNTPTYGAPGAITPPANTGSIVNPNAQPGTPQAIAQNQQSEATAQAVTHNGADVPLRGMTTVPNAYTGNPTTVPTTYQVKPGDTINNIAAHLGVPPSAITGYRSGNPNLIYPGETLNVGPTTPPQSQTPATTPSTTSTGQTGTSAPVTTDNGKTPTQNVMAIWTDVATSLGLPSIKAQFEKTLKDQQDLQDKMNGEINDVNNNPWLSTGVRERTITQIKNKYETRLNTLSNFAKLYETMYEEGSTQARFLAGHIETDTQNAIELAQKKLDAASAIAKDNEVIELSDGKYLVNKVTGAKVAYLGANKSTSTTDSSTKEMDKFQADIASGITALRNGSTWGQVFNMLYDRYANGSQANRDALKARLDAELGSDYWSKPGAFQDFKSSTK